MAEEVFKNVEIMKGHPAGQMLPMMMALRDLLGVDCSYCHTAPEWESGKIKSYPTTRMMFRMQQYINTSTFDGKERVNCWTCHRSEPVPAHSPGPWPPPVTEMIKKTIELQPEDEKKPAEQVFKNIRSFQGMPAGQLPAVMVYLANSLGVKCGHCHVKPFSSDEKPEKQRARQMLAMVGGISKNFYGGGNTPVECYNCHRGQPKPPEGTSEASR